MWALASLAGAAEALKLLPAIVGVDLEHPAAWRRGWEEEPATPSAAAAAVLALDKADRGRLKAELAATASDPRYKGAKQNLDLGRHEVLKQLLKAAVTEANARLQTRRLKPLDRVLTLNSGGYGDFGRDQDITAFAGDDLRERVFFEAMRDVAERQFGLRVAWQSDALGARSGVTLPGLEVTFHRGGNELPDTSGAQELHRFALDYRKVIEQQAKMPEAYYGYGAETEVQATRGAPSRQPGRTRMQILRPGATGVTCTSVFGATADQVRSETGYRGESRVRRAQNAVHIVNDALQAAHHRVDPNSSESQGPLKYAGRALDQLCQFNGMAPWPDLAPEDRVELLRPLLPRQSEADLQKMAAAMGKHLDVAHATFTTKQAPTAIGARKVEAGDRDAAARVALIFLKNAAAHTTTAIVDEMVCPPPFDYAALEKIGPIRGKRFGDLPPEEQVKVALEHDRRYRESVSVAAMENLLVTMRALRQVQDLAPELGRDATQRMLARVRVIGVPADQQPVLGRVLQLAADHADVSIRREASRDPAERRALGQQMDRIRFDISQRAAAFQRVQPTLTGAELLTRLKQVDVRRTIADLGRPQLPPDLAALDEHRQRLNALALPGEEPGARPLVERVKGAFKLAGGLKTMAAERLYDEAFQWGNVGTALQMIELYQNGADYGAYAQMVGLDLAGRFRWYLGYVGQAALAKDEKAVEDLGKNILFDLATKFVPGAGTVKMIFDLEVGLVNVTVGYTFNQLNASLIDAVYTGAAGRTNEGTAGKRAGAIRDAGIAVLEPKHVSIVTDPKTKRPVARIDRSAVYRHFFQVWTGVAPDDAYAVNPTVAGADGLFQTHARVVALIRRQAQEKEPLWPGDRSESFNPQELETAMDNLRGLLRPRVAKVCQDRLSELGVREFFVKDEDGVPRDQIFDGLTTRLLGDVLTGLIETTQNSVLSQAVAKRRLEGLADAGDMAALAEDLGREIVKPRPAAGPRYYLELQHGLADVDSELDGTGKLPLQIQLRREGGTGAMEEAVTFEFHPGPMQPVDVNYRPAGLIMGGESAPRPGLVDTDAYWMNVVRQPVEVRALVNGREVAKTARSFFVRLKKWVPPNKNLRLEDIKLPNEAWPEVFYVEKNPRGPRRRGFTQLTGPQPLENWDLQPGRSTGWAGHAKEVYNFRVLGGAPGQVPTAEDIKINDEQELDMSWVIEKADGVTPRIESVDLTSPDEGTGRDVASRVVRLTPATKGRLAYRITRNAQGAPSAFNGTLWFMVENVRAKVRMKSRTGSSDGAAGPVNDTAMPDMMVRLGQALATTLENSGLAKAVAPARK